MQASLPLCVGFFCATACSIQLSWKACEKRPRELAPAPQAGPTFSKPSLCLGKIVFLTLKFFVQDLSTIILEAGGSKALENSWKPKIQRWPGRV